MRTRSHLQRDWKTLGPKLAGKLHFYVGEADTFYLDRVRKPHCYIGDIDPAAGFNQHYWPEMVKHMEETAPAGADLKSWKY